MDRALVVVDDIDGIERLVREAAELAVGVDGTLVLLHVESESEYEQDRRAVEGVMEQEAQSYDIEQAEEGVRRVATDIAERALADIDVEYETVGAVGNRADQILHIAESRDCDHIFISGARRSPTGKAIFGDSAQKVILNFRGPVTIVTGPLSELNG